MKKALITGITGQDGSYLTELLLSKGYEVHGIKRRSSSLNTGRIDHLYEDPYSPNRRLHLHYGDLTDTSNLVRVLEEVAPDEVYNLAAQSHVQVSFDSPEYTADTNALGALRLLEGIRFLGLSSSCKYYQASTSELYGLVQETPQSETTAFYPRSPYAVAKLFAYWITINYREAYKMFACNGVLFNHESSRRGETFVTRKITRGLSRISQGLDKCLYLGNLDSMRDWGHARDYVEMQYLMLQQDEPVDYVIATGWQISVREFVTKAAGQIGIEIEWVGSGLAETGRIMSIQSSTLSTSLTVGQVIVRVDSRYFRPAEVDTLLGDSSLARERLGWEPKISLDQMIEEMISMDLLDAKKHKLLKDSGYVEGRAG